MGKKGNKTRSLAKFTEEEMRRAVLRVAVDGVPINRVCEEVGFCKKTLKSYVDKYLSTPEDKKNDFIFRPNYEINQVFTHDLEKLFEDYLLCANSGEHKLTRLYVRRAAFEFAMTCNLHVPKTWNVRQQAGLDWMYGFLNRHPTIKRAVIVNKKLKTAKSRSRLIDPAQSEIFIEEVVVPDEFDVANEYDGEWPEGVELAPSKEEPTDTRPFERTSSSADIDADDEKVAVDHAVLRDFANANLPAACESSPDGDIASKINVKTSADEFAENLREAYYAISQDGYVPSDRVYSMDEISLVVENPRSEAEARVVVTACCFVGANGSSLPPFVVFPRAKMKKSLLHGYAPLTCGVAAPDGLVDDDVFLGALQHFRERTRTSRANKILLIADDDDYHVTVGTIDYCDKYGIELVTLPPNCAGRLQPIGRYAYKHLKAYFYNACLKYRARNPHVHLGVYDVSSLFNAIYAYAFTAENIVRGFSETGVYPLDETVFAEVHAVAMKLEHEEWPPKVPEPDVEFVPSAVVRSDESDDDDDDDEEAADVRADRRTKIVGGLSGAEFAAEMVELLRDLATEYDRTAAANFRGTLLDEYFDQLVFAYNELNEYGSIAPDRVYNMDELELTVRVPDGGDSGQRLRLVACCCVNAAGRSLPPCFVRRGDGDDDDCWTRGISGAGIVYVDSYPTEGDVFVAVLEHFGRRFACTPENRVLLIVDDEHGHVTLGSIDFCRSRGIILVTVPPTAAVPLQPLEKSVYETLTANFGSACERHMDDAGERTLKMRDLATIFKNVYAGTFVEGAIISAFHDAGIWPLCQEKFTERPRV